MTTGGAEDGRATGRLWDRGEPLDQVIARFTVGRDPELDQKLVAFDALASAAHATMLASIGVLDEEEHRGLMRELGEIAREAQRGAFPIRISDEDGHTAIENRLTARLGDGGRRIHTGRSRNDQVIAALRLFGRDALLGLIGELLEVVELEIELAQRHAETTLPGYTHTRQAMPSTLGLLFGAHAESGLDAIPWLQVAFGHLDRSPLGSASGYGVALPLDRQLVARLLGFEAVQINTLAVQNDRGKSEALVLAAVSAPVTELGRLAADLILFSSDELGFIRLPAEVTTGSSIMPQKRNPDVLELVRASAARLRARQAELGGIYGPLTSGYHRDLQLTKEPFLDGMQLSVDVFAAMRVALAALEVDTERCRAALLPATGATDEVYRRVAGGVPFRRAYKQVASDPRGALSGDLAEGWRDRPYLGTPAQLGLDTLRQRLAEGRAWVEERRQRLDAVWQLLSA